MILCCSTLQMKVWNWQLLTPSRICTPRTHWHDDKLERCTQLTLWMTSNMYWNVPKISLNVHEGFLMTRITFQFENSFTNLSVTSKVSCHIYFLLLKWAYFCDFLKISNGYSTIYFVKFAFLSYFWQFGWEITEKFPIQLLL